MSNTRKLNTKATGVIAVAVMCSRLLGLVREVLFAGLFGSGLMGIFTIAFRAPNLLRDLFAEGALSTAFVTVFSKKMEAEGDAAGWRLASKMLTLATVFMSLVSLLGVIFAQQIIRLLAPGFEAQDAALTVLLTQIMYPFILMVSLAALVMGMLNAKNVFGMPAMASSFFNIGSILGGAIFGWLLDPGFGERALVGLALGTLVGGMLQLVVQLPSLWHIGFRFQWDCVWRDPGVRQILVLMVPSVIAASAVQINVLINSSFASFVGKEAVSWLNFAFRLMQLPLGVFGVAVATITLPVVSRIAAHVDATAFGPTLGKAMRLATFLTLPSAVGLYMLAHPIIRLIYERGEFTAEDSLQTSYALQFYALGLVAYSCIKVLSPAFYAIDRKWTPMLVSFAAIGVNLGLNYLFVFKLQFAQRGLALSTAISATLNFLILYGLMVGMQQRVGRLETGHFLFSLLQAGVAAAALGGVCWAALHWLPEYLLETRFLMRALSLFGVIGIAGSAYLVVAWVLRVDAMQDAARAVARRLRKDKRSRI